MSEKMKLYVFNNPVSYTHLVEIPPKMSVSSFVGFLKGKSSLIIFERHSNLKYKYGNRQFWCRGYYVEDVYKRQVPHWPRISAIVCVLRQRPLTRLPMTWVFHPCT